MTVRSGSRRANVEALERRLRREIWRTAPLDAVLEAGVEARCFGPVLATAFGRYPRAGGLNTIEGAADAGHGCRFLAEAVDWMVERRVDFLASVPPNRRGAAEAERWLSRRGFEQGPVTRVYVRRATPPDWADPPGIEIVELRENQTEGLSIFVVEGYGLPQGASFLFCGMPEIRGCRCYSAYLDGDEVACGSMLIAGGFAMLAFDATTERARGRGCHRALLRRRIIDAMNAGCHTVVASAPDDPGRIRAVGSASLLRAGFEESHRRVGWRPPYEYRRGLAGS